MPHNGKRVLVHYPNFGAGNQVVYNNLLKHSRFYAPSWWDVIDDNGYITDTKGIKDSNYLPYLGAPAIDRLQRPGNYILRGKGSGSFLWSLSPWNRPLYKVPDQAEGDANGWEIVLPPRSKKDDDQIQHNAPGAVWGLGVIYYETDPPPNHIRDLALVHEDAIDYHDNGKIFDRYFIEKMREFGVVRLAATIRIHGGPPPPGCPEDWIPYEYATWSQWPPRGRTLIATAVPGEPWNYQCRAPTERFEGKPGDSLMVQFPHGNRDPLRITEYLPGEQTKVKVVRHKLSNRPAKGWSVDPTVWFVGQLCTMSSNSFGSNIGPNEGMVVTDVELTSDPAMITVDWPTPGAPVWKPNLGDLVVVPHLKVGDMPKMRLTGQCEFSDWPNMQNYGNEWPDEGPGSGPRWAMCVVNGFGTFTPEEVDQYGSVTFSGPAPWLNIALCNEIGAHPMFYMSQCAMHSTDLGGAQGASANYLPTTTSIGNYARALAQLCKNTLNPGLIPIFEGPYEITSSLGGVWYSTQHGWGVENRVFNQDIRANMYLCSASSLLGQIVADVYDTPKSEVHHQNNYRVVMLLPPDMMNSQFENEIWGRLAVNAGENSFAGHHYEWLDRGGDPPLDWITHFCMHGYYTSAYHNVTPGVGPGAWSAFVVQRLEMMAAAFASGNSTVKDKIVRAYISAVNPEQWSSSKQYAGPQPDGTTDVVYWHPSGMNNYPHVYLAKRPSHNRAPTTSGINDDWDVMSSAILPWSIPFVKWGLGRVKEYRDEWAPDVRIMGYIGGLLLTIHNSGFTNTREVANFLWAVLDHPVMKDAELASLNIFNEPGIDFPAVNQLASFGTSGVQPGDTERYTMLLPKPAGVFSDGPRYEAVVEFNRSEEDDLVFPSSPTAGQIYGRWRWDGRKWVATFSHPAQWLLRPH